MPAGRARLAGSLQRQLQGKKNCAASLLPPTLEQFILSAQISFLKGLAVRFLSNSDRTGANRWPFYPNYGRAAIAIHCRLTRTAHVALFDDLVGGCEQSGWHNEAYCLGRLK